MSNKTNTVNPKVQQAIQDKVIYVARNGISFEQVLRLKKMGFIIIFR